MTLVTVSVYCVVLTMLPVNVPQLMEMSTMSLALMPAGIGGDTGFTAGGSGAGGNTIKDRS